MNWGDELTYFVTPKSGPMQTLRDVNHTILDDLSFRKRQQPHWISVARLLLIAADTGSAIDVRIVTEALVRALEAEGWMTRQRAAVTTG